MVEVIRTERIVKRFGQTLAVDNISITVKKGEIYGFLGLNGAGKTTLIRMLLGLIKPTSGKVFLNNKEVKPGLVDIWEHVGYLVETPYAYPDLTVSENLEIIRKLRGISDKESVDKIINKLNLKMYKDVLAKHLSLGNAQRLGIAKALIHNPSILILDEPANGLDPAGIVEIRELLKDLALNHGVTIFISSHILDEISRFANRIGIIHNGMLLLELTEEELQNNLIKKLFINTRDNERLQIILQQEGYHSEISESGAVCLQEENAIKYPDEIATMLVNKNVPPTLLKVVKEDLETFFLRIISTEEVNV